MLLAPSLSEKESLKHSMLSFIIGEYFDGMQVGSSGLKLKLQTCALLRESNSGLLSNYLLTEVSKQTCQSTFRPLDSKLPNVPGWAGRLFE